MNSVSFARTLLIIGAYVINIFLGLAILAIFIYLLQQIAVLPSTWMPKYYEPTNRFENTSWRQYYREVWCSMSEEERAKARKDRFVNIVTYILFVGLFAAGGYIIIRFVWPALISLAKTM